VDKIYKLEEGLKTSNSQRIFLVSNSLIACKRVLDQIQSEISLTGKPHVQVCHHLLVVPFVPPVLHNLVEEEGQQIITIIGSVYFSNIESFIQACPSYLRCRRFP